jgi:hypothetical protein
MAFTYGQAQDPVQSNVQLRLEYIGHHLPLSTSNASEAHDAHDAQHELGSALDKPFNVKGRILWGTLLPPRRSPESGYHMYRRKGIRVYPLTEPSSMIQAPVMLRRTLPTRGKETSILTTRLQGVFSQGQWAGTPGLPEGDLRFVARK